MQSDPQPTTRLTANVARIAPQEFADHEAEWRSVEAASQEASPYLTYDWLRAWVEVYQPSRLALVRVADEGGDAAALALLHVHMPRIWRFAGAPVSSERGLLCAADQHEAAWAALGRWLSGNPRKWAMLDGQGIVVPAGELPGTRRTPMPVLGLNLPSTFEEYLANHDAKVRAKTRKRVRRLERSSAHVRRVADADLPAALRDFVRLHELRARSKRERHPEVDDRLARQLEFVSGSKTLGLVGFELIVDGRRAGVTLRIDRGSTAYSYNDGLDPAHMALSPGILLELESIRDAIEQGIARYDLGPGDYPYKRELGAVAEERHSVKIVLSGARGRMAVATIAAYRGLRGGLRRAAVALTSRRHGALALGLCEPALSL